MVAFFAGLDPCRAADAADGAWAVRILTGEKLKRVVSSTDLRTWAAAEADIAPWLFEECDAVAGDLAETISLLLDRGPAERTDDALAGAHAAEEACLSDWIETRVLPLRELDAGEQQEAVRRWWRTLDRRGIFLLCKLLTGGLRVGVSKGLLVRALARHTNLPEPVIAHRLMGQLDPTPAAYRRLLDPDATDAADATPYPFFLATPVQGESTVEPTPAEIEARLGPATGFQAEWK